MADCRERGLYIGDALLCSFLFFPLMVSYWRGIWDLWGAYIIPDQPEIQNWVLLGIGSATISGYFCHPLLAYVLRDSGKWAYIIASRLYMVVFASIQMAYWRAVWSLEDHYLLPLGWYVAPIQYVVCATVLLVCKCHRTVIFSPLVVPLDIRPDVLIPSTKFGVQVSFNIFLALLDCVTQQNYCHVVGRVRSLASVVGRPSVRGVDYLRTWLVHGSCLSNFISCWLPWAIRRDVFWKKNQATYFLNFLLSCPHKSNIWQ